MRGVKVAIQLIWKSIAGKEMSHLRQFSKSIMWICPNQSQTRCLIR